jgi:hypothetical protein
MTYDASVRVWYGPESYQHAGWLKPTAQVIGVGQPLLPCIVYRPGGGWAGADAADPPIHLRGVRAPDRERGLQPA